MSVPSISKMIVSPACESQPFLFIDEWFDALDGFFRIDAFFAIVEVDQDVAVKSMPSSFM